MIDIEQIINKYPSIFYEDAPYSTDVAINKDNVRDIIKEFLKLVIPEILEEVANSSQMELRRYIESGEYESVNLGQEIPTEREMEYFGVSKKSITSLSESLIEKYTK